MRISASIGACRTVIAVFLAVMGAGEVARPYVVETTVPQAGGCAVMNHWNASTVQPLTLRWSTSLPATRTGAPILITSAPPGSTQQLDEIEGVITASLGAWTGVSGTTVNPATTPGVAATITRTSDANACTNDAGTNVDGLNTICFNESSTAFTNGVLAFTRTITANAPGVSVGGGTPADFAGQLLDSDTLFDNTGQSRFATPSALGTPVAAGAYDLESLVMHELGHYFGLDHSAVRRAILFPFAPPAGQFIGDRPTAAVPDSMLANDDRTGLRAIYPDAADTVHSGEIHGRIVPANPFALAPFPARSPGESVTGIFGTQVVAEDADTGEIFAAGFGGWSCDTTNGVPQFDGSYRIERLPVGGNYKVYVEPLDGLATAGAFYETMNGICDRNGVTPCTAPVVNTNLTIRIKPN